MSSLVVPVIHWPFRHFGLNVPPAVFTVLVSFVIAFWFYLRQPGKPEQLAKSMKCAYTTLLNEYYVDELYAAVIVKLLLWISTNFLWKTVDVAGIDGAVDSIAH